MSFKSISQYDSMYALGNFKNERSACGLFSILTASEFLLNGDISPKKHNNNIDCSIANFLKKNINGFMSFNDLLKLQTNEIYNNKSINATTYELVKNGIISYNHMFPTDIKSNYAVIFLKNSKFFVVLVNNNNQTYTYHLRDCHETEQWDFISFELLQNHLNTYYQFDKKIELSGELGTYEISEWGSIEFLVCTIKFNVSLDLNCNMTNLHISNLQSKTKNYKSEYVDLVFTHNPEKIVDRDLPHDFEIHDEDDFITEEKRRHQIELDEQMALLLQQEETN